MNGLKRDIVLYGLKLVGSAPRKPVQYKLYNLLLLLKRPRLERSQKKFDKNENFDLFRKFFVSNLS